MKWIAAILMVANVLIFLGISDRQVESPMSAGDIRPDVNPESMLLLMEVQSDEATNADPVADSASGGAVAVGNSTDTGVGAAGGDDLPTTVLEEGGLALVTIGDDGVINREASAGGVGNDASRAPADSRAETGSAHTCYRIGPFRDSGEWRESVAWVEQQDFRWEQVRSASRELRAVRVYIGPYESIGAAQSTIELLKQKDLDHFVYLREGNARVSLGYFTQEELATKYVNYLTGQGIDARSQPEYRTLGPFNWMDVRVGRGAEGGLLERQWGAEDVKVTEKPCSESA